MYKLIYHNSFFLAFILTSFTALSQQGMVDKPGGGQVFSAEQYKIDRMKSELKSNTNLKPASNYPSGTKSDNNNSSTYEPGAGWRTSTRVWRSETLELDYRSQAKKAKSKETKGLEFKYPKDKGVEVTHENEGIAVFDNSVFHDHRKKKDWWYSYNNFLYELDYSFKQDADSSFGFGLQFIGKNDDLHECNDYTFFSFFITAGGELFYYKKRMGKNDKFTTGFFDELKDDIPEMFELYNYNKINEKISLKDTNHLFVSQWKNELVVYNNGEVVYQDRLSHCPVQLSKTPYNLFLNKGAVIFYKGEEMYVEKKHL